MSPNNRSLQTSTFIFPMVKWVSVSQRSQQKVKLVGPIQLEGNWEPSPICDNVTATENCLGMGGGMCGRVFINVLKKTSNYCTLSFLK